MNCKDLQIEYFVNKDIIRMEINLKEEVIKCMM